MDEMIGAIRKLSVQISQQSQSPIPNAPAHLREWAVVTAVVTGPPKTVTIKIAGSSVATAGIRYDNSYTPTVNDTVRCERWGSDWIVLGKLA